MAENLSEGASEAASEGISEGFRGFGDILIEAATGELVWVLYPLAISTLLTYFFSKSIYLKIGLTFLSLSILLLQIPSEGWYRNVVAFFITAMVGFAMLAKWRLDKPVEMVARMR